MEKMIKGGNINMREYNENYIQNKQNIYIPHVNADVICFRNKQLIKKIIKIWCEQIENYKSKDFWKNYNIHTKIQSYKDLKKLGAVGSDPFIHIPAGGDGGCIKFLNMKRIELIEYIYQNMRKYFLLNNLYDLYRNHMNTDEFMTVDYDYLSEQGVLNSMIRDADFILNNNIKFKFVDDFSSHENKNRVCYNVMGRNVFSGRNSQMAENLSNFYLKDNKLYNHGGAQIKVWHHCVSLGSRSSEWGEKEVDYFLDELFYSHFNDEVKKHFEEIGR